MSRLLLRVSVLLCASVFLLTASSARAEDEPKGPTERIAWFSSLVEARKVAAKTGRPIFVAMHVRPRVASPAATARTARWLQAYHDPDVVALSRQLACVLRVTDAPPGQDPDVDAGAPAAVHLVIDADAKVLARLDADMPPATGVVERLMRRGLRVHGEIPRDAPLIDERIAKRSERSIEGLSPMSPVGVPVDAPGVRLRLKWELPAPTLVGEGPKQVRARILMEWDQKGPFLVGGVDFKPGEEIDVPVDIHFEKIEGLKKLATPGLHRVDLYMEPDIGSFPFSKGPLHVGRVWIELGDGGGGGGEGANQDEQPQPEGEEEEPDQNPDGNPIEEPVTPDEAKDDVIDPFIGDGETVKKDDAIVAVEDENAGVKPPEQVPLDKALREFEKEREAAIRQDGISPRERAFLKRYFALLEKHARGGKPAPKKAGK